ncbi:helix-turn-helix transcriptional regulator [Rahnella victoriana]|uniref:helix-turn-helix transcriptional regulator n=1 Tax=Rahnella victoriana TaxID=1510570 RepID=UPI001E4A9338|nr:LuxR C-terminal-related transcriptional regulator [Rahnella victoriana]UHM93627.1 LuxR C-terminal-related transcriptional regulator [Rahnella victoriana]
MLYIFSDDFYFSRGAAAMLSEKGVQACAIHTTDLQYFCEFHPLCHTDVIIVTFGDVPMMATVLNLARKNKVRVVFVMNIRQSAEPRLLWEQGILSKNLTKGVFMSALATALTAPVRLLSELTSLEQNVLDELLAGKDGACVSAKMQLSIKTVSRHKLSALRKLGLHNLNSRAIVLYGKYRQVQLYKGLNKSTPGRVSL